MKTYKETELKALTKKDIVEIASELDIKNRSKYRKEELVELILDKYKEIGLKEAPKAAAPTAAAKVSVKKATPVPPPIPKGQEDEEEEPKAPAKKALPVSAVEPQPSENWEMTVFQNVIANQETGLYHDQIRLMQVNPEKLFTHWNYNCPISDKQFTLRLVDVDNQERVQLETTVINMGKFYFVVTPDTTYQVKLGHYDAQGNFVLLLASNLCKTQRNRPTNSDHVYLGEFGTEGKSKFTPANQPQHWKVEIIGSSFGPFSSASNLSSRALHEPPESEE